MAKNRRELSTEETIEVSGKLKSGREVNITAVKVDPASMAEGEMPARLTVKTDVYYESFGNDPVHIPIGFSAICGVSEDDVYNRRIKATEQWALLDTGWVETPGLIILKNMHGKDRPTKPSEEEMLTDEQHMIEIRFGDTGDAVLVIRPGHAYPIPSAHPETMQIRSGLGETKLAVWVLPR